jgi:hypothetical protein
MPNGFGGRRTILSPLSSRFASLRRALDLPRSWEPILVVPIGDAKEDPAAVQRVMLWR